MPDETEWITLPAEFPLVQRFTITSRSDCPKCQGSGMVFDTDIRRPEGHITRGPYRCDCVTVEVKNG